MSYRTLHFPEKSIGELLFSTELNEHSEWWREDLDDLLPDRREEIQALGTISIPDDSVAFLHCFESDLSCLAKLQPNDIQGLYVAPWLQEAELQNLHHLTGLQFLRVYVGNRSEGLTLPPLPNVKRLELICDLYAFANLDPNTLLGFPSLIELVLSKLYNADQVLASVGRLRDLETLNLQETASFNGKGIAELNQLEHLKYLTIDKPSDIRYLFLLKSLRRLDLRGYDRPSEKEISALKSELSGCEISYAYFFPEMPGADDNSRATEIFVEERNDNLIDITESEFES